MAGKKCLHFGKKKKKCEKTSHCLDCNPAEKKWWNICGISYNKKVNPNEITTTIFTPWTVFPLSFLYQFKKKANIYFLLVCILSLTPLYQQNKYFASVPLTIVLSFSIGKDIIEFIMRRKEDRIENTTKNKRLNLEENKWEKVNRESLKSGDIVLVKKNKDFPVDLLLVASPLESGLCSISTAGLDGETNLKIKRSIEGKNFLNLEENKVENVSINEETGGFIECDAPNARMDLNGWKGILKLNGTNEEKPKINLNMENFVMRGSVLKNMEWVIGIAIFTGNDTKMQQQIRVKKRIVKSSQENLLEKLLLSITLIMTLLILISVIFFKFSISEKQWYLYKAEITYLEYIVAVFILLNNLIPISLYVTIEFSKLVQAYNINNDKFIASKDKKNYSKTRTSALTDDLGNIDIIFSDKTGTLTKNNMVFSSCSINGEIFEVESSEKPFNQKLVALLEDPNNNAAEHKEFVTLLSLCHTVLPEYPDCDINHIHSHECKSEILYQAESPDESALLVMAKNHGYSFIGRRYGVETINEITRSIEHIDLKIFDKINEFDILECFEFDSTRKRQSVVVKNKTTGKYKLYLKGAENVVYRLLTKESKKKRWEETIKDIEKFDNNGLRVLLCAYKDLEREEYEEIRMKLHKIKNESSEEKIEKFVEEVESGLTLIGATAVEDELQDNVPKTLRKLKDAGISLWILTGDKTQTAFNIAKSCGLLEVNTHPELLILEVSENETDENGLKTLTEKIKKEHSVIENNKSLRPSMMINGRAFGLVFPAKKKPNLELKKMLFEIFSKCKLVMLCRVSPLQKSQIVAYYMKNNPSKVTLAIGDGANDVPMLQIANIGVGIKGREGQQASRAADFSINEFQNLNHLILYHGATNKSRILKLINFSFYKNFATSIMMYCFTFFSGYSFTILFPQEAVNLHNMIYSHYVIFIISVSDSIYSRNTALKWPLLYKKKLDRNYRDIFKFFSYCIVGSIHAIVVFFLMRLVFGADYYDENGGLPFCYASLASYNAILGVITLSGFLLADSLNYMMILAFAYTTPAWAANSFAFNIIVKDKNVNFGCVAETLGNINTWVVYLFSLAICSIPVILVEFCMTYNNPSNVQIIKELEKVHGGKQIYKFKPPSMDKFKSHLKGFKDQTINNEDYYRKTDEKNTWKKFVHSKLVQNVVKVD